MDIPFPKMGAEPGNLAAAFAKKVDINRLGNNPTKLTVEDVEALYRKILVHK